MKSKIIKKGVVVGLATIMTVASSMSAFAASATMYPGGYAVRCNTSISGEFFTATMDSSWEMEMKISGMMDTPTGSYPMDTVWSDITYGIKATEYNELGFTDYRVECEAWTVDTGEYAHITL